MSELNAQILKQSYGDLKVFFPAVIDYYFDFLIVNNPELEKYFINTKVENHFEMIANTMNFIIENIENKGKIASNLIQLGKKLSGWNIQKEHYVLFLNSFLLTLEHFYLAHWNENIKCEWERLITFVISCLVKGTKASEPIR